MSDLRDHPDFEEYRKANDLIIATMRESHQVDVDRAEKLRRNRDMYKAQNERQAQRLLDQRYKFQRLHKATRDLVELVEWHAYRGEESQRRLSVVKTTLKEFGPEGELS